MRPKTRTYSRSRSRFVERLPEHRLEGAGLERLAELQHAERHQQSGETARRRQQEVAGQLERERDHQAGLSSPPIRRDAGGHLHRERGDDGHRLGEADAGVVGEAEVEEDPDAEPEAQARQQGDEVEEPEVRRQIWRGSYHARFADDSGAADGASGVVLTTPDLLMTLWRRGRRWRRARKIRARSARSSPSPSVRPRSGGAAPAPPGSAAG